MPNKKRNAVAQVGETASIPVKETKRRRGLLPFLKRKQSVENDHISPLPVSETPAVGIYAPPQVVSDLAECYFYHTMEIPGYGLVEGEWDLRAGLKAYLGGVDFAGKRVLEMGAASGFLTLAMEACGASVVAYDLSPEQAWDVVPMAGLDYPTLIDQRRAHIRRINKGFWLNHRANNAAARMVHGTVYTVPEEIGAVDIATFCAILLHVRDPFLALQNALRLTRETVIITEMIPSQSRESNLHAYTQSSALQLPAELFVPNATNPTGVDTWWELTPEIIRRFIGVLGFEESHTTFHEHPFQGTTLPMFTVVGHRTKGNVTISSD